LRWMVELVFVCASRTEQIIKERIKRNVLEKGRAGIWRALGVRVIDLDALCSESPYGSEFVA